MQMIPLLLEIVHKLKYKRQPVVLKLWAFFSQIITKVHLRNAKQLLLSDQVCRNKTRPQQSEVITTHTDEDRDI